MVAEIELTRILATAMGSLIGKGIEKWSKNKPFKDIAEVVKESLARELRLARMLIDELEKVDDTNSNAAKSIIACIETKAFDAVSSAGVPLSKIFPRPLDDMFWNELHLSALENNYVANTDAGYLLIEKTYLRLKMFIIRQETGYDRTKIDYLKKLLRASIMALTERLD